MPSYKWQVTSDQLQVTSYKWQVTSDKLQVACYMLQVTIYKMQVTSYYLQVFRYTFFDCLLSWWSTRPLNIRSKPRHFGVVLCCCSWYCCCCLYFCSCSYLIKLCGVCGGVCIAIFVSKTSVLEVEFGLYCCSVGVLTTDKLPHTAGTGFYLPVSVKWTVHMFCAVSSYTEQYTCLYFLINLTWQKTHNMGIKLHIEAA